MGAADGRSDVVVGSAENAVGAAGMGMTWRKGGSATTVGMMEGGASAGRGHWQRPTLWAEGMGRKRAWVGRRKGGASKPTSLRSNGGERGRRHGLAVGKGCFLKKTNLDRLI